MPVVFAPSALTDRDRLAAFLSTESPAAADRAVEILASAFERLGSFPLTGKARPNGGRVLVVRFGRGGYAIRYRIIRNTVVVSRVFHTREAG